MYTAYLPASNGGERYGGLLDPCSGRMWGSSNGEVVGHDSLGDSDCNCGGADHDNGEQSGDLAGE